MQPDFKVSLLVTTVVLVFWGYQYGGCDVMSLSIYLSLRKNLLKTDEYDY